MNYFDILLAKKLESDKDVSIVQLNVSENGTYSESGKAYSPVVVDVQPPPNSYLKTPIDSYPATAQQLPIPKCDVEIANQKSCKVFVSNKPFVNDKIPYIFRKSAGGDRVYEKLIGGTIAWNQLVQNGNFADTSGWGSLNGTMSVSNNILTITRSSGSSASNEGVYHTGMKYVSGHKYIAMCDMKASATLTNYKYFSIANTQFEMQGGSLSNSWNKFYAVASLSSVVNAYFNVVVAGLSSYTSELVLNIKNCMLIDLTQLFGSAIADYIYSLEQSTAGAGVTYFRQMFPSDYYAYDSGSLQSVNVASKKVYDSNNTLVATYAFDSDLTLRGIPKLDTNNNLYYDGDVYESDGTVTRKYGVVDLGSLTWTKYTVETNLTMFRANISDIETVYTSTTKANVICSNYPTVNALARANKTCYVQTTVRGIDICDNDYTDAQTFKTAMSGVYLVYELAIPTTESADTYINPQMVDADGTEEFVDYAQSQGTRDVAVPVGHDSLYYNGQVYQTNFEQATTETINMAELHSIVPPSGEFYMASNGTLSVDVWKK